MYSNAEKLYVFKCRGGAFMQGFLEISKNK
jgi:hypothetical protein